MGKQALAYACLTIALLAVAPGAVRARALDNWPYDRLFKQADLVVIAEATGSVDANEVSKLGSRSVNFVGVNTTFTVHATLKGKLDKKGLTFFHYRLPNGEEIINGPLFVTFRLKGLAISGRDFKMGVNKPHYLLFLKKRKDGRFEAVSGQVDPSLSVREMHRAGLADAVEKINKPPRQTEKP
jgi:hypothetical protein